MSFDAGAVIGRLELDPGGFTHGMLEAEGIAKLFPAVVWEFIEDPLLGAGEALRELSEKAIDTFNDVANEAESMNLLAQKLGVPVEVFSSWAQFARTVNVAPEQFAQGLRMLEQSSAEAMEQIQKIEESGKGTSKLAEAFEQVGISVSDLKSKMNDPMALFIQLKEGIDNCADANTRMRLATELLGGRQSALVPLLLKSKDATEDFMKTLEQVGGVTTTQEAIAADKFNTLKVETQIAFEGMAKAASLPVLTFLADHMKEIQPVIIQSSHLISAEFEKLFAELGKNDGKEFLELLHGMAGALEAVAVIAKDVIKTFEFLDSHPFLLRAAESAATMGGSDVARTAVGATAAAASDSSSTSDQIGRGVLDAETLGTAELGRGAAHWLKHHIWDDFWNNDSDGSEGSSAAPAEGDSPAQNPPAQNPPVPNPPRNSVGGTQSSVGNDHEPAAIGPPSHSRKTRKHRPPAQDQPSQENSPPATAPTAAPTTFHIDQLHLHGVGGVSNEELGAKLRSAIHNSAANDAASKSVQAAMEGN
jgi:hypothetical protein